MKKILLSFLILIACVITFQINKLPTQAETNNDSLEATINTLYLNNILDYQNLDGISSLTVNNEFIAYSLNSNVINIINKETRQIVKINDFENIIEIKFSHDNALIVVNYNGSTGNIYKVEYQNNTYSYTILDIINITNLIKIDIYNANTYTLVGLIRENNSEYIFESYKITNSISFFKGTKHAYFKDAYALTITDTNFYVLYKNESDEQRIITKSYNSEAITSTKILPNIQLVDYITYKNNDYLVAFTKENLNLISTSDFENEIHKLSGLDITDIEIYNNEIYICNSEEKTITSYIIKENNNDLNIQEQSILISSTNDNTGRFNEVSNIFISGNTLFVADTNNDRIQAIIDNETCNQIIKLEDDTHPHSLILDSNRNIYFVQFESDTYSSHIIQKYSQNGNTYSKSVTYSNINLGLVSDTTVSNYDDILILDHSNNKLFQINASSGLQEIFEFDFDILESAKIEFLKTHNLISLLNNDKLYLINPLNFNTPNTPLISELILNETCKDITCDIDSIITLYNNHLGLVNISNNGVMQLDEKTIHNENFSNFANINYDIVNQKVYGFNNTRQCIEYCDLYLTKNHFNFAVIKDNNLNDTTSSPFAINVLNNGIIYDMPYNLGNCYLSINKCIGIENCTNQFSDYYRVLFEYNGILKVGFLNKTNAAILNFDTSKKIKVITTNLQVPVYKYPTILKFENQAIITSYIPINTYVDVTYYSFPVSIDNKQFYCYEKDGKVGYIFNADIVLDDSTNIVNLNTNNASISAIGEDKIHIYDEDKTTILATLHNETQIYVENYDKKSEYTKVIYKDSDLNTITGYVKTEYIQMDKLDNTRIILICIIILSVIILGVIITSYIIIKKKKQ